MLTFCKLLVMNSYSSAASAGTVTYISPAARRQSRSSARQAGSFCAQQEHLVVAASAAAAPVLGALPALGAGAASASTYMYILSTSSDLTV